MRENKLHILHREICVQILAYVVIHKGNTINVIYITENIENPIFNYSYLSVGNSNSEKCYSSYVH